MKKQLIATILIILLSSSMVTINTLATDKSQTETISFSLTASSYSLSDNDNYLSINIPEATGSTILPTYPKLPKISKTIQIPFGSHIESFSYITKFTESRVLNTNIIPVAYPSPTNLELQVKELEENKYIYSSTNPYPKNQVESKIAAGLTEESLCNILTINWYPIQYIPQTNTISFTKEINIDITYSSGTAITQNSNENTLVIIGPPEFADEAQRLINHKNNLGLSSVYTSLDSIYGEYEGRDHAEKVKYYLYDSAKNLGTTYVLLLGNLDKTPMREAAIRFYHDETIITDLYYADVFESDGSFSSWDSNNDDKFSEYNWDDGLIDSVDLYPDIHVGRIPCRTEKEVERIVDKIITYENSAASSSWYKKIILMAGDTFPGHGVIEGEVVTQQIADMMQNHGFETVKLWTSLGTFHPLKINNELTKGAGFISYSGHGYEQGFGTSPPDVEDRIEYFSPYLIGVFNGDKLPVIFFDACSTTKLDFTIEELLEWYPAPLARIFTFLYGIEYEMDNFYPTISWELVKKTNGGCIASIGSTRVAFTGVDEDGAHWGAGFLNTHFYQAYEPGARLGELFTQCQIDYLNEIGPECITLEEFILVGDPSLQLG